MSVTLKDIAKKTGFSTATISLVLNNKPASIPEATRKLILDTANSLGYIPKKKECQYRTLSSGSPQSIFF